MRKILDWAKEFDTLIDDENGGKSIAWDWLPAEWMSIPEYYNKISLYDICSLYAL